MEQETILKTGSYRKALRVEPINKKPKSYGKL